MITDVLPRFYEPQCIEILGLNVSFQLTSPLTIVQLGVVSLSAVVMTLRTSDDLEYASWSFKVIEGSRG